MAHSHTHAPSDSRPGTRRRLTIALAIIGVFLVVQLVGALASGSLALLADSGHLAGDGLGLVIALAATIAAARPATERHTFGFRRIEVLGALANGVLLSVVSVAVAIEAIRRLASPQDLHVEGLPMVVIAGAGLLANIAAYLVLRSGDTSSIGLRAATLEVLGDMLGSVAALVGGVVVLATGWAPADAVATLAIAALILPRALLLLRDVARVLTESAPADLNVAEIRRHLERTPGVIAVHDLHVWSITSGSPVFSVHLEVEEDCFTESRTSDLLADLADCLRDHFGVEHSTFQLEPAGHVDTEPHTHE